MHRLSRAAAVSGLVAGVLLAGPACGQVAETAKGLVGAAPTATATPRPPTLTPIPTAPPKPAPAAPAAGPAAGAPRDVVIEVTEADLNAQLAQLLVGQSLGTTPIGDATVHSVTVTLRDGQIGVGGQAAVGPLGAPFSVTGRVAADATGRPRVAVTAAQVGGFGLPEPATTTIAALLQQQLDALFDQQTLRVRSVEIADGRLRIVAVPAS